MIIRHLEELAGTEREVKSGNWINRQLLLKCDGMGFSLHETLVLPGTCTRICYRHHLQAVLCLEGNGAVELACGELHPLEPGVLYALDQHEWHYLHAVNPLRLLCVFVPPLAGDEVLDAKGGYPLAADSTAGMVL